MVNVTENYTLLQAEAPGTAGACGGGGSATRAVDGSGRGAPPGRGGPVPSAHETAPTWDCSSQLDTAPAVHKARKKPGMVRTRTRGFSAASPTREEKGGWGLLGAPREGLHLGLKGRLVRPGQ